MRMHHRFIEFRFADFAVETDLHVAYETEAVDFGFERADAVRQSFRQHRHNETRKVHRCSALLRFVIQRRAGFHVMRDIGDRYNQPEAAAVGFAPDRVVEIFRVFAIDGDQRQLTQIDAPRDVAIRDLQRHRGGLSDHVRRKFMRQIMPVDGRFDHQRRRQLVAEHCKHAADRRPIRVRRMHDLADHQLAAAGVHPRVDGDLYVALDAGVVRYDITDASLQREPADQPIDAALQHFHDGALATAAAIDAGDAGHHPVAVQHLAHFHRRQEQVVAGARVGTQKTEAVGIRDYRAGDQIHPCRRQITAASILQQLTVAQHRGEALVERIAAFGRLQAEVFAQALSEHRAIGVCEQLQDRFAAGDGVGVARRFTGSMRVVQRDGLHSPCFIRTRLAGGSAHRWLGCALPGKRIGQPWGSLGGLAGGLGAASGFCWPARLRRLGRRLRCVRFTRLGRRDFARVVAGGSGACRRFGRGAVRGARGARASGLLGGFRHWQRVYVGGRGSGPIPGEADAL